MNPLVLLAVGVAGWFTRRAIAARVERESLRILPRGGDGIIAGAESIHRRGRDRRAVLILHGFGDTPQTVSYLAAHLHGLGFTVRAPLLAGHGRTLREFGESTADAWLDAAARELAALRQEYESIGIVGLSMGGALSVILADASSHADGATSEAAGVVGKHGTRGDHGGAGGAGSPGNAGARPPDAIVLIAPYLSMHARTRRLAAMHWALSLFVRYLPSREEASITDELERKSNLGFGTITPRLLNELLRLVSRARRSLPHVAAPTLVIQSRDDNRIDAAAAEESFDRLGARPKRFEWTDGGHVITVDVGRERVFALTGTWLLAHVGHDGPAPPSPRP